MNRFGNKEHRSPGRTARMAALCAGLLLLGASCGQRGPLYLPRSDSATGGPADVSAQPGEAAGSDSRELVPEEEDGEIDEATP